MKKFKSLQLILIMILCISLSTLFVACGGGDPVKISFETNGGTTIAEMEVDDDFQMPTNPTKPGCTFVGWYLDEQLTTPFDETKIDEIKQSFKVFAKWADKPLDQISISTPVLSSTGNVVSWSDVTVTDDLSVVYFVSIDNGAALAYSANSVSLDMFTTGEHSVSVYAALASNNAKKSETATKTIDVEAVEDNAVINTGYAGTHSTLAQDGDDKVLVFYLGLNEQVTNATNITVDSPIVEIANPNNGTGKLVKPKSIGGPFELKVTSSNGETTYKAYVRPRITGFTVANNNVADRANTNFQNKTDASYKIGVDNEFKFNTTILDGDAEIIDNRYVPLAIEIKNGNSVVAEGENTYQNDKGELTFSESLVGETYAISIIPKYFAAADADNVKATTMNVTFVDGINVYTNEQLQKAVQDCSVSEITIHNTIVAQYNDEQKLEGVDYARHIDPREFTKANYKKSASVYARYTDGTDSVKSLTINGNYFDIDAKNLPRLKVEDGKNDDKNAIDTTGYLKVRESGAYEIYSQESGIFAFASAVKGFSVNINNLHITGNCDLSEEDIDYDKVGTDADVARQAQEFIKKQSGSLHGIVNNGITLNSNNVWIQNVMQGYQLRHTASLAENYATNQMITQANVSYTRVENTFYSAMFVVNAKATVDHSYFTNTGSAIFCMADDYQYGSDTENETSYATFDATKSGVPYDPELIADSSNVYDSWAVGNEAYYSTEDGMSGMPTLLKQKVNENLTENGTNHTITDGEKFNFILQFINGETYRKMSMVFMDGNTEVSRIERCAHYTIRNEDVDLSDLMGYPAGTVLQKDPRIQQGAFMAPIGAYSNPKAFLVMASQVGQTAFADSFNNGVATFGKGSDKAGRKMLEVIYSDAVDITAIVEVMPVAQ